MKGLALAEKYWDEVGRPAVENSFPELLDHAAFGMAGEGSDNFGFDDDISADHDWGPGFCIWIKAEDMPEYGQKALDLYNALPAEFMGHERKRVTPQTAGRVGPSETERFYLSLMRANKFPETNTDWMELDEHGLSAAVNGKVFLDRPGDFSAIREKLKAYYPEAVIMKKLAGNCARAAQSGQYNYNRSFARADKVACMLALSEFIKGVQGVIYLFNKEYMPYYKWTHRKMRSLPVLGRQAAPLIAKLAAADGDQYENIEAISAMIINELKARGLTSSGSDFLLDHAVELQMNIPDQELRRMDLFRI